VHEADGKSVKPLSPYTEDNQRIMHEPFIDYETEKISTPALFQDVE